jgi:DNA-binding NarL/FixJ family response regulator
MIKVLHLDDDRDHHELTKLQLSQVSDDIIFEHSDSLQAAKNALKDDVYDCILTDEEMPENVGINLLKTLRKDGNIIPFVVLSRLKNKEHRNFAEKVYANDEFNVAVNYFHFDILNFWIHRLVDKYRQILQSDKIKADLFQSSSEKIEEWHDAIKEVTKREIEILNMIGAGKSNKEIAEELFISYWTVKNHVSNLFSKLGIHTRAEAMHVAISLKLTNKC